MNKMYSFFICEFHEAPHNGWRFFLNGKSQAVKNLPTLAISKLARLRYFGASFLVLERQNMTVFHILWTEVHSNGKQKNVNQSKLQRFLFKQSIAFFSRKKWQFIMINLKFNLFNNVHWFFKRRFFQYIWCFGNSN